MLCTCETAGFIPLSTTTRQQSVYVIWEETQCGKRLNLGRASLCQCVLHLRHKSHNVGPTLCELWRLDGACSRCSPFEREMSVKFGNDQTVI